jgi:hypothetical protein
MTSLAAYSKRPYVSFTERMREQALLRQQMQNEAEQRAYTQQKNALDLAQAEENLRQAQSGFGQNVPSAIQEYNFIQRLSPQERALFLRAKSPYSKIPFETMGMTGDMGDMGQQDMVAPPMQQGGMPPEYYELADDIKQNELTRTTAPVVQGPPMPTQRKPVGQGRMPEGAPLPPQGAPQPQVSDLPQPPIDLGNGMALYKGQEMDKKTAERIYLADAKNPSTVEERQGSYLLQQANFAYKNLLKSLYTEKGERTGAERPNAVEAILNSKLIPISPRIARSTKREQFVQATETIADALLRAATGAGQNMDEARRKIEEITPSWFDDDATIKQKLDSIPAYIESIKARAGRATPKNFTIPTVESVVPAAGGGRFKYLGTE